MDMSQCKLDRQWAVVGCAGWEDFCFIFSLFTASCTDLFSSALSIPVFTTALQCPRSSAATSHVVMSIPATFMSRLHDSL